jgi:uncharacterized protein YdcH (DUF465 family)
LIGVNERGGPALQGCIPKTETTMSHTPHGLHEEFPEYAAAIHQLKIEDMHFRRLFDRYHDLNREIHRAETDVEPMDDFAIEDLKKRRLALKDEIASILRAA